MMNNDKQQAHPAAVAQEFMRRADMKGGEVEAFSQTFNWLATVLDGSTVVSTKEAHQAMVVELQELRDYKEQVETDEQDIPVLS